MRVSDRESILYLDKHTRIQYLSHRKGMNALRRLTSATAVHIHNVWKLMNSDQHLDLQQVAGYLSMGVYQRIFLTCDMHRNRMNWPILFSHKPETCKNKLTDAKHPKAGHLWPASEMPFEWRFAGGLMVARPRIQAAWGSCAT